ALAVFMTPVAALAQAHTVQFDIPAQSLGASLRAFGLASGQSLMFSEDDVRGKAGPALKGAFSVNDGLSKLLAGSGLAVKRTADGVVYLGAPGADSTESAAPKEPETQSVREVVVTGYRLSVNKALDDKRRANVMLDEINAEDVGKFPDANLAESLQRL